MTRIRNNSYINNNNNKGTAPPDDGEGGIQMSHLDANINNDDEIQRTATSRVAVKMDDINDINDNNDKKEDENIGIIQHDNNTMICEDNLWKEIGFGSGRTLQIYKRKKTNENENKEDNEYDENTALTSSKTTRRKRRLSMFEKQTVRNTKFGAERAWLPGSAPDWLVRWLFNQKHIEPIENDMHMLITDNQRLKNYTQQHKEENNNNNNNNNNE
eukprot:91315_1